MFNPMVELIKATAKLVIADTKIIKESMDMETIVAAMDRKDQNIKLIKEYLKVVGK